MSTQGTRDWVTVQDAATGREVEFTPEAWHDLTTGWGEPAAAHINDGAPRFVRGMVFDVLRQVFVARDGRSITAERLMNRPVRRRPPRRAARRAHRRKLKGAR